MAQTAGQVRRFGNGIVARTEFSSSTGGWTAGGTFPVVPDEGDTRSPHHTWTVAVPAATVEAAYPGIGSFRALDVTQRNGVGDWGGRVVSAVVRGSAGAVTATGDDLRNRLGLRSSWFKVATSARPAVARGNTWFLRSTLNGGPADASFDYGNTGDAHLMCDWDGDGSRSPGVGRGGWFYLRNSNSAGVADIAFQYGNAGDTPLCATGTATGSTRSAWCATDGSCCATPTRVATRTSRSRTATAATSRWCATGPVVGGTRSAWREAVGSTCERPTRPASPTSRSSMRTQATRRCGDWNGDGIDTVGAVRAGTWYLRDVHAGGAADLVLGYGDVGDQPLVWR